MKGTVKSFDSHLGYGFIEYDGSQYEIFFHKTALIGMEGFRSINAGEEVEFEIGEHDGRRCAIEVQVV